MAHAQACEVGVTVMTIWDPERMHGSRSPKKMLNFYQDNFFL
jgi:hypothetical protein